MGKRSSPYVASTERMISELGLRNSSAQLLPPLSVILSSRAPIGHLVINTELMATNQGCKGLIPGDNLQYKFLYYYLNSIVELLNSLGTGTTFKELSGGKLKEVQIPVPPLAEQKRIVAKLDEAFAGLAKAKENAEKNLQNARALFESYLNEVFTKRGEGWVDRKLATLCHEITVGHVGSMKMEYKQSGIPFLRSQNIRPFEVSMENVMYIGEVFHRSLKKSQLRPGDLAIVRTGYPGTAAVIPPNLLDSNCSDLVIARSSKDVNPHFLAAFFNSDYGKQLVLGKIVGAAQKHFNITAAKEVLLHVPSIQEQRSIVSMVDDLRDKTQSLARLYEQRLGALESLKKSILHEAFSGNL
jgi:type I restriction enzyme S subunit